MAAGRLKEKSYDPYTGVSTLQTAWVSRASEKQRRGRAGRCQPGVAFHCYSCTRSQALAELQLPELKRSPLDELCLQVSCNLRVFRQARGGGGGCQRGSRHLLCYLATTVGAQEQRFVCALPAGQLQSSVSSGGRGGKGGREGSKQGVYRWRWEQGRPEGGQVGPFPVWLQHQCRLLRFTLSR